MSGVAWKRSKSLAKIYRQFETTVAGQLMVSMLAGDVTFLCRLIRPCIVFATNVTVVMRLSLNLPLQNSLSSRCFSLTLPSTHSTELPIYIYYRFKLSFFLISFKSFIKCCICKFRRTIDYIVLGPPIRPNIGKILSSLVDFFFFTCYMFSFNFIFFIF